MTVLTAEKLMKLTSQDLTKNIELHVHDCPARISLMISRPNLLDYWSDILTDLSTNIILKEIGYDLLSSIYISTNGMYRNAYISLRSAVELGISFFYFTDHNYHFLQWKRNVFDMTWSRLVDVDKGVLSNKYLSLFNEAFNTELFIETVKEIYRNCSEYVHGKYEYMHSIGTQRITYDKAKFMQWSTIFLRTVELLLILLSVRFTEKINDLNQDHKETMNEIYKNLGFGELEINNE
ncbi:hypothetical protein MFMK1_000521 [Metallumcola ferriviriculae]|uniref:Uncharacterized protein n=1 Tax=Metallumcola ferriviriculae TaxID=3039180 RepID=A0AAU0UK18_9FIRM|nr:hypothetical protein MFMK1_000521 [Desulfitibacteraceae bacterium MK1]